MCFYGLLVSGGWVGLRVLVRKKDRPIVVGHGDNSWDESV